MAIIINADDFGMFESANRGILYCLEKNLINSVSVCVNHRENNNIAEILPYWNKLVSIGLHINLTEGYSLCSNDPYIDSLTLYEKKYNYKYFYQEIESQIIKFKELLGFFPEHLDCHQHYAYLDDNAYRVYINLAQVYNIPIRSPSLFDQREKLEKFFQNVKRKHNIEVPFNAQQIAENINSIAIDPKLVRSEFIHFKLKEILKENARNNSEIVCHPQITHSGEKNQDIIFLETNKIC